jgi:hypothetical protein
MLIELLKLYASRNGIGTVRGIVENETCLF